MDSYFYKSKHISSWNIFADAYKTRFNKVLSTFKGDIRKVPTTRNVAVAVNKWVQDRIVKFDPKIQEI